MNGHPQFDVDFDLYALGALEGEELQTLESHLESCPECLRRLEEARGRLSRLALSVPPEPVPPEVLERLLGRVHAHRAKQPAPIFAGLWRWATPALALALLLLVVALGLVTARNRDLTRRVTLLQLALTQQETEADRARHVLDVLTAADTVKVTLVPASARPVPQGKAFYHAKKGLLFYAANLPALPTGRTYQLWLVPAEGKPISAGVFQTDAQGNGSILLPPLPPGVTAKAFAVTVEPAGGVPQPTGQKVLIGLVS